MKSKVGSLCIILVIPLFLMGCWDRVEIDRRAFISTIAIDVGDGIGTYNKVKDNKEYSSDNERNLDILKITYGYPDISQLGENYGSKVEEKKMATNAYSIEDSISKATRRSSRNIHLGHSKILIISREMLNYPDIMREIMDYFRRSANINRRMQVIIVDGKASEYEKFKPEMENNFQTYITGILENSDRNVGVLPLTLNDFISLTSENRDAMIPYVQMDKNKKELALNGVALVKDYKIVGFLDDDQTSDIELLKGKSKAGKKVIYEEGNPVDYVIENVERKIKLASLKNDKLELNLNVKVEGAVTGFSSNKKLLQSNAMKEYEKKFNIELNQDSSKLIEVLQKEYRIDPLEIKIFMQKFHPYKFKSVEKNWDEVFKNAKINIKFHTKIRRIGITA